MATHILLTGLPGCGKTTLVRRIIEQLGDLQLAGFYTQERRGSDGRRTGFQAMGLKGASIMLADVRSKSRVRVARYGVELPAFEQFLQDELNCGPGEVDLFVVDEVGKMERCSQRFIELVGALLDGDVSVLSTVAMKGGGFIADVKERNDVELVKVHNNNRDRLVSDLVKRLRHSVHG